jgi:hypothetical protein
VQASNETNSTSIRFRITCLNQIQIHDTHDSFPKNRPRRPPGIKDCNLPTIYNLHDPDQIVHHLVERKKTIGDPKGSRAGTPSTRKKGSRPSATADVIGFLENVVKLADGEELRLGQIYINLR